MDVAVFGGGIAGLAAAHELLAAGARVTVFEAEAELGGQAKSSWAGDLPTEVSWRGYAPFYVNTFEVMRRIPRAGGGTVYDNLSRPIHFIHPRDGRPRRGRPEPRPTLGDYLRVGHPVARAMAADRRPFSSASYTEAVGDGLSRDGRDAFVEMIGPGLGLHNDTLSLHHMAWFLQLQASRAHTSRHGPPGAEYVRRSGPRSSWQVMSLPTNAAWIDPWAAHLEVLGGSVVRGAALTRVDVCGGRVCGCRVAVGGRETLVHADAYVVCVDPYSVAAVFRRSGLVGASPGAADTQFDRVARLAEAPPAVQISFRMVIRGGPPLPPQTVIALPDSEFNLTLCPQELFFPEWVLKGRRIWSGTACRADRPGRLFGLPAQELTEPQFEREVIYQVTRSAELGLSAADVAGFEVWRDWTFPPAARIATSSNPKWINGLGTFELRPSQRTEIPNLLLAGAHTRTSVDLWSMEGAVESGKKAAAALVPGVAVFRHRPLPASRALAKVDNLLYAAGLPSVVDWLLAAALILVVIIVTVVVASAVERAARGRRRPPPQAAR